MNKSLHYERKTIMRKEKAGGCDSSFSFFQENFNEQEIFNKDKPDTFFEIV